MEIDGVECIYKRKYGFKKRRVIEKIRNDYLHQDRRNYLFKNLRKRLRTFLKSAWGKEGGEY